MKGYLSRIAIALWLLMVASPLYADQLSIPQLIGYHSMIFDEGGNPIADGEVGVTFRIVDAAGNPYYEERQRVVSVGGQVSALVGNGLTAEGAPTGGVTLEAVNPAQARYLEVAVDGMAPLPLMELASVPYATYSQKALGVAEGSIDSTAIKDGAISFADINSATVDQLGKALTGGKGSSSIVLIDELSAPAAASTIGVATGLAYTSATELQGVLHDFDQAIAKRQENIAAESSVRESVDASKVSKSGDTMTGSLNMQSNIEMASGATVDGVDVSSLQDRVQLIENPPFPSFHANAWGTISYLSGDPQHPSVYGENIGSASTTPGSPIVYHVVLATPMSNSRYAVAVTPTTEGSSTGEPYKCHVFEKTAGGFSVSTTSDTIDFIVMGH